MKRAGGVAGRGHAWYRGDSAGRQKISEQEGRRLACLESRQAQITQGQESVGWPCVFRVLPI